MLPAWWLQPLCVFLFPFLRSLYKNTALLKIKKSDLFCYIYNDFKKALIYHPFIDFLQLFDFIFCRFIGFLTDEKYFVGTMVVSMIWKTFGWNTIIYLAAITGIDPQLYEAATVDGANRWQKLLHITLPCIRSIIIVVLITRIGGLMQAGFEQIFVLYHPGVYGTADIIDTYVYRMGLQEGKFELATAVGLFKSVINFALVVIANKTARMAGEEGIY